MWLARDKYGYLFLFDTEPVKDGDYWKWEDDKTLQLNQELFPMVTFDNSPAEVELAFTIEEYKRLFNTERQI